MYYLRKTHYTENIHIHKKSFQEPNAGHLVWKVVGPGINIIYLLDIKRFNSELLYGN